MLDFDRKEILQSILVADDVVESIRENLYVLIEIVPEIQAMIGFEHNHPHHHLDVFEHTLLALSFAPKDFEIRLALLLHDIGKPFSYQDEDVRHFKGHVTKSFEISKEVLKRLNFEDLFIDEVCEIIKEHDSPIMDSMIKEKFDTAQKLFKVQECDTMAHNPEKLEKRIDYLRETEQKFKEFLEKEKE